jgi:hypothetical protein
MAYEDELQEYFDGLSDDLREQLSGVIREEAEKLSAAQRARLKELEQSPEDTGHLEESCAVIEGANDLEFVVVAGGDATTDDGYDHALGFQFGTTRQPARDFFFGPYNELRDEMQDNINTAIEEVLKNG